MRASRDPAGPQKGFCSTWALRGKAPKRPDGRWADTKRPQEPSQAQLRLPQRAPAEEPARWSLVSEGVWEWRGNEVRELMGTDEGTGH